MTKAFNAVRWLARCGALVSLLLASALHAQGLDLRHSPNDWQLPAQPDFQWLAPDAGPHDVLADAWQRWPHASINLIDQTQALWLRIPLTLDPNRPWRLYSEWPQMGDIAAYWQAGDGQLVALPLTQGLRYPVFALPQQAGSGHVLLKVHYPQIALVPLRVLTEPALQDVRSEQHGWLGVFFGIGLAVALYNLFLWISTRITLYLWYVLFQMAVYAFEWIRFGLHEPWFGPMAGSEAFILTAGASFWLVNMFSVVLLNLPRLAPKLWHLYRWLLAALGLFIAALATPLAPYLLWLGLPLATLGTVLPLLAFYQVRSAHSRYIWLYGISWGLLITGTLLFNMALMGFMPVNSVTNYAQLFGLSLEAMLLSFLLGLRLNDLRRQRTEIAEELLSVKNYANQRLEQEVALKTASLNQALSELKHAHAALGETARRDALTGQYNRRHFDETLALELQRARREGSELSLALVDIDHFKAFNDRHGHLTGDDCLRAVAQCLAAQLRRPQDVLARYGGEEFALILPDTALAGAHVLLESARAAVQAMVFELDGERLPVTVSIGVASVVAQGQAEQLIAAADQQLYAAKAAGRNRVKVAQALPTL